MTGDRDRAATGLHIDRVTRRGFRSIEPGAFNGALPAVGKKRPFAASRARLRGLIRIEKILWNTILHSAGDGGPVGNKCIGGSEQFWSVTLEWP